MGTKMNYREIAELCLKILAFYWLLVAINQIGINLTVLVSITQDTNNLSNKTFLYSSYLARFIIPLISSLFLFLLAKPLSKFISTSTEVSINIKLSSLHFVLLSIFGFILISLTIIPMTGQFIILLTENKRSSAELLGTKALLFGYFIQLILGLWFAFGAKGISHFIYKLRYSNR